MSVTGNTQDATTLGATMTAGLCVEETTATIVGQVRAQLGRDAVYLSEFVGDIAVIRAVSAPGLERKFAVGDTGVADMEYYGRITSGRLPTLIADTGTHPFWRSTPLATTTTMGAFLGVPIERPDGRPYGMLCCLSRRTRRDLTAADLDVARSFAFLVATQVETRLIAQCDATRTRTRIEAMLSARAFDFAYQPMMDIPSRSPVGFDAICRFQSNPYRPSTDWFDAAKAVGLHARLEISVIEAALHALTALPDDIHLSVSASTATVASGALTDVFLPWPGERIVLHLVDYEDTTDDKALRKQLDTLRFFGVRIAMSADGHGLDRIRALRPDFVGLDLSTGDDTELAASRTAMARVAAGIDADIVVDGLAVGSEAAALATLGVPLARGRYLGRTTGLDAALAWFDTAHQRERA